MNRRDVVIICEIWEIKNVTSRTICKKNIRRRRTRKRGKKLRVLERKQKGRKVQWYVKFGYYKQEKAEENARRQEH